MNVDNVFELQDHVIELIAGGVTMSPDGKSCTEPRDKDPQPGLLQGGPEIVSIGLMMGQ